MPHSSGDNGSVGSNTNDDDHLLGDQGSIRTDTTRLLNPHFYDESRGSPLSASIFTLVCTIMGGTVLSLPWAMNQTGMVLGLFSIVFWGVMAYFSIYILVMCARRGGDTTYEEVAVRAFGPRMKVIVIMQVVILCWMSVIAYIVLSGTMFHNVLKAAASWRNAELPSWASTKLSMILVTIYVTPRCFATQLSSLRWTSLFSFCSIVLLGFVVAIRSIGRLSTHGFEYGHIRIWPQTWQGIPYSLPLFCTAFVCHPNVLPMHAELMKPTRQRLRTVVNFAIASCTAIYTAIATFGYLYDTADTCDNIMLNFCDTDPVATIGRIALVLTITFNLPLLVIPCRSNIERLFEHPKVPVEEVNPDLATFGSPTNLPKSSVSSDVYRHIGTILILGTACLSACFVPGVSAVWTLTGSTVSLMVAFVMPCAFYLKLRTHKDWNIRKLLALFLLLISSVSMVLCTFEAVKHVISGHSSSCPAGFNPCI